MNKKMLESFAKYARKKLIEDVTVQSILVGITENGINEPSISQDKLQIFRHGDVSHIIADKQVSQRNELIKKLKEYETIYGSYKVGYEQLIENIAYTWFNRIIAIRYMEVNNFLPSGVRVLSSNSNRMEPDIMRDYKNVFKLSEEEQDLYDSLSKNNNSIELYQKLFIKQCNELNSILPGLFALLGDYSELLIKLSYIDQNGIIYKLIHDISEDDFKSSVEVIGWLYQYYNIEKKDKVINLYKASIKKEDIPVATQLFTPDWIVQYMVDNSLGRYWVERNDNSELIKLQYLVKDNLTKINDNISIENITFFDPSMGSGHILVYAFDLFMQMYAESGYTTEDAVKNILEKNIFGLDIDERAYQLAYFAIMMKARQYDRNIFNKKTVINIYPIIESSSINYIEVNQITYDIEQNKVGNYLINTFKHAGELGSIQHVENHDYEQFSTYIDQCYANLGDQILFDNLYHDRSQLISLSLQAMLLSKKYTVVCTNPPYLGKMTGELKNYIEEYFKDYKYDLFSVFIRKSFDWLEQDGYSAFMTPFVWMFITSYEKLRKFIVENKSIVSLIQLEYSAFEEATVPLCTFILQNKDTIGNLVFFDLSKYKGGMNVQQMQICRMINLDYAVGKNIYHQSSIRQIPGYRILYSPSVFDNIKDEKKLEKYIAFKSGIVTGNVDKFVKNWFEVAYIKIKFDCKSYEDMGDYKWFPINDGGGFRKYYGNNLYIVDMWHNGLNIKNSNGNFRLRDKSLYFKKGLTWGRITSSKPSFRIVNQGMLFGDAGPVGFLDNDILIYYILGFLNSIVAQYMLQLYNPTLNYQLIDIKSLILRNSTEIKKINVIVSECINICKLDWDSFEISWDFIRHPFLNEENNIELAYKKWEDETLSRFNKLKDNEEELNKIFIKLYGLENELSYKIEDEDISVNRADLTRDVKSFISYGVGCILGRYSLDVDGIAYAGGKYDEDKYKTFKPVTDGIVCISNICSDNDLASLFFKFIKVVFGSENYNININFIAHSISNEVDTAENIIRKYFMNEFFQDHCAMYKKTPIYWLYSSGRNNAFKAYIYIHRYASNTTSKVNEYLLQLQKYYRDEISRLEKNKSELTIESRKFLEQYKKAYIEITQYYEKLYHLASHYIDIDLDDGILINYNNIQTDKDGKLFEILEKIR